MSVDQILHVFFPLSRGKTFASSGKSILLNFRFQYYIVFICANLSNSWYVNTKSRAWQMSVDQIFHFIFFFSFRDGARYRTVGKKWWLVLIKFIASSTIQPNQTIFQFKPYYYIPEIELLNGDAQCELPI